MTVTHGLQGGALASFGSGSSVVAQVVGGGGLDWAAYRLVLDSSPGCGQTMEGRGARTP